MSVPIYLAYLLLVTFQTEAAIAFVRLAPFPIHSEFFVPCLLLVLPGFVCDFKLQLHQP